MSKKFFRNKHYNTPGHAHPSEMAADAILKCGKPALPFLKEKAKIHNRASELVNWIESEQKTVF